MAHLHAADALEARLRAPPPAARCRRRRADRRHRHAAAAAGDARLAHVARRVVPIHRRRRAARRRVAGLIARRRRRARAADAAEPGAAGGARELTKRSEEPPPQRVKWKPPRGVGQSDLPKGTRIQLAGGEYVEAKLALEGRLRAQLDADHRPLAYEARLSALYAIDPMSALSEARTVRQGATSIEERLRRELRASASAPEL